MGSRPGGMGSRPGGAALRAVARTRICYAPKMWRIGSLFLASCVLCSSKSVAACNIVGGKAYGDCAGVTVKTGSTAFEEVAGYKMISGVSDGVRVLSGGAVTVTGIADRVVIEDGGSALILGIAHSVTNKGGFVRVSGMVDVLSMVGGRAVIEGQVGHVSGTFGELELLPGSVVSGVVTNETRSSQDPSQ